ncbi:MAG: hypothetical protein M1818_005584 [Claussenomyces sp. TS43310]|nr:MAG: hypothetical protein M1818_005584 [Claussenomyces sp. TS43310]
MGSQNVPRKLWQHPDPSSTAMFKLMQVINKKNGLQLETFHDLYDYSVRHRAQFWDEAFHFLSLIYSGTYGRVVDESARIDSVPQWFEGVRINIAENLLHARKSGDSTSYRGTYGKEDDKVALTEIREGYTEVRDLTWGQLRTEVAVLVSAMKAHGVKKGDRVAVVASNSIDTIKVFFASTALGSIFSSSSTDMGTKGILDRLSQIEPKYLFMDDWAVYNGKTTDLRQKMTDVVDGMKAVKEFEGVVSMPRFKQPADVSRVPKAQTLERYLSKATSRQPFFEETRFRDPFMIAYSSGTTGTPKCIVHSNGGAVLSSAKEIILHREMGPEDVCLQYTTTGWIMYYCSIVNLLPGSRAILYDGSPFQPDATTFIRLLGEQKVTNLGTSPKWMSEIRRNGIVPKTVTDLSHLQVVVSTGMVLDDQLFEWFYDVGFPQKTHLANISGGTDIAGCFAQENPLTPVYVGGLQGPSLGTALQVYDSLVEGGRGIPGSPVSHGTPGELVATAAFPNMPTYFWKDTKGERYFSAYFEKYDNVWTQGDFVAIHPVTQQITFLGRADGVLNPAGVRFGSAEIYSVLESQFPQVSDSICVGQRRPQDDDEAVLLFLLMKPGQTFTQSLVSDVKTAIRKELSARHVPKYVFETPEIPTTVNLKKVELPVKQIVSGRIIKPSGTLLNPASLDYYYQFAKVEELLGPKSKI